VSKLPNVRLALQREAQRVKSALDDFADLARPKRKAVPPVWGGPEVRSVYPARAPYPAEPAFDAGPGQDEFFGDFDPDGTGWAAESAAGESSDSNFSPGVGDDFAEGIESEMDIPGKVNQDTLSVPALARSDDTPADGTPKPTEAINDILDGFDW
jgi:hypothetical protein